MQIEISEEEMSVLRKIVERSALINPADRPTSTHLADGASIRFLYIPEKDYFIGKYPVTQTQYAAVMGTNPSHFKGAQLPVETVSWDDAQEFCKRISMLSGQIVRLPSEPEWEHSCRAGTTTEYCSGDTESDLDKVGWYYKNSGDKTNMVGQKQPNAWGLHDMHGNVWEWCEDKHSQDEGAARVLCGGSWRGYPEYCRSAYRSGLKPDARDPSVGFRVVLVPSSRT